MPLHLLLDLMGVIAYGCDRVQSSQSNIQGKKLLNKDLVGFPSRVNNTSGPWRRALGIMKMGPLLKISPQASSTPCPLCRLQLAWLSTQSLFMQFFCMDGNYFLTGWGNYTLSHLSLMTSVLAWFQYNSSFSFFPLSSSHSLMRLKALNFLTSVSKN